MATVYPNDDTFLAIARGGKIAKNAWPDVLDELLNRLRTNVYTGFEIPSNVPFPPPEQLPEYMRSTPPSQAFAEHVASLEPPPSSQVTERDEKPVPMLPLLLLQEYQQICRVLQDDFMDKPPYTIQRLVELALWPHKYYKHLPQYLKALEKVVTVSSSTWDFPLNMRITNSGGFLSNGDPNDLSGLNEREGLGSDESLGGALLTPIPWLRNSHTLANQGDGEFHSERTDMIIGPNGAGSVETVSVTMGGKSSPSTSTPASPTLSEQSDASTNSSGSMTTEQQLREQGGVTQGELLRQEQEAGVIPVSQLGRRPPIMPDYTNMRQQKEPVHVPPAEELPHARGPEKIGFEDTGVVAKTDGHDMEAAVGRGRSVSPQPAGDKDFGATDLQE